MSRKLLKPIDRNEDSWQSREDHEAWVRGIYEKFHPGEEPRACDCGYWGDDWLVVCAEKNRWHCRLDVEKRLRETHKRRRQDQLKKKREFPPLGRTGKAVCYWCRGKIVHGRAYQRSMHDGRLDEPNCRREYELRTNADVQRAHLIRRDGLGCKTCGAVAGRWQRISTRETQDRVDAWYDGGSLARWFSERPGPMSLVSWQSTLEVDHVIPLAAAWEAFSEAGRRRWFFGPANLQALCSVCHTKKTVSDRALIRHIQPLPETEARAIVLDLMAERGLLKSA